MNELRHKRGSCIFSTETLALESRVDGQFAERAMLTKKAKVIIESPLFYSFMAVINNTEYKFSLYKDNVDKGRFEIVVTNEEKLIVNRLYIIKDWNIALTSLLINALWDVNDKLLDVEKCKLDNEQIKCIVENWIEHMWFSC